MTPEQIAEKIRICCKKVKFYTRCIDQLAQGVNIDLGGATVNVTAVSVAFGDLTDPIPCSDVAVIVRRHQRSVADKLRSHGLTIAKTAGTNYCQYADAAKLWRAEFRKYENRLSRN